MSRRRQARVVTTTALLCVLAAVAVARLQGPRYASTATLLLEPSLAEQMTLSEALPVAGAEPDRTATEVELMRTPAIRQRVAETLGWVAAPPANRPAADAAHEHDPAAVPAASGPDATLTDRVTITRVGDSGIVAITALGGSGEEAARIAQTYADVYVVVRREQRLASLSSAAAQVQVALDEVRRQAAELDRPLADLDDRILAAAEPDRPPLRDQRDQLARRTQVERDSLQAREAAHASRLDAVTLAISLNSAAGPQVVGPAVIPAAPSGRRTLRYAAIALPLGVLLGAVVAVGLARVPTRGRARQAAPAVPSPADG